MNTCVHAEFEITYKFAQIESTLGLGVVKTWPRLPQS